MVDALDTARNYLLTALTILDDHHQHLAAAYVDMALAQVGNTDETESPGS